MPATAAAFVGFHEPLAVFLENNVGTCDASGDDTLLASREAYNNFVRLGVWHRVPDSGAGEV